jgi:hypothetical protein
MLVASGCALVSATDVSQSSGPIELPGIGVTVVPHNEGGWHGLIGIVPIVPVWETPPARSPGEFWISVRLDPEGEDFTFDPRAVALRVGDGAAMAPGAFSRPREAGDDPRLRTGSCARPGKPSLAPTAPISITQLACVDVRFDIDPPPPAQRFAVTVSGIRRAGQAYPTVEVSFHEGKRWQFGVLP